MDFRLDNVETEKWKKFDEKHRKKCEKHIDTIGTSRIETTFIATGLGYIIRVKCRVCGKEKDITNYDMW